jgi:hypothetical protein
MSHVESMEPHTIRTVEFATELPTAPGHGGIEAHVDAELFHLPVLADCRGSIRQVSRTWVTSQQFSVLREETTPGRYLIHVGRHDINGFFEVLYRLTQDHREAQMKFRFYAPSGLHSPPDYVGIETSTVSTQLIQAVACTETL